MFSFPDRPDAANAIIETAADFFVPWNADILLDAAVALSCGFDDVNVPSQPLGFLGLHPSKFILNGIVPFTETEADISKRRNAGILRDDAWLFFL